MSDPPKRRFPRRLARGLLWTVGILAVLLALLWALAHAPWTRQRVQGFAEARLRETLGREVEIGSLDYELHPLVVVAEDVEIAGSRPAGPPFARLPRLRVELSFTGWFHPTLTVERVDLERPEVWLVLYADGTNNLPDLRTGQGGGRLQVVIGRLVVDGGVAHFEERDLPLSVDAQPVRVAVEGPGVTALPKDHLVATLVAQQVSVGLPEARPWGGGVTARAEISPGRVHVTRGRLSGPDLQARFEAVYHWSEEARGGEVEVDAQGDAALANRLGYLEPAAAGRFRLDASVDLDPAAGTYRGTVTAPRLGLENRRFDDVEARFSGGADGLVVDLLRASHAGGTLTGTVTVPAVTSSTGGAASGKSTPAGSTPAGSASGAGASAAAGRPVRLEATARGLALSRLIADLDLADSPLGGLQGSADGDFDYRFDTSDPLAGDGEGVVRLSGVEHLRDRLAVHGRVPLRVAGGVLAIRDADLAAPGQRLTVSGTYDLETGGGSFRFGLDSEQLGRLARAVPLPKELTAAGPPPWLPTRGTGKVDGTLELRADGSSRVEAMCELAAVETPAVLLDRVRAPLTLADGVLESDDLLLAGAGQRLMLSGRLDLGSGGAEGQFRLTTEDLGALARIATSLAGVAAPGWLPSAGTGSAEGELTVPATGGASGRAELTLAGVALPAAAGPAVTLDHLGGAFRVEPDGVHDLRLEASTDGGALVVAGALPLPPLGGTGGSGETDGGGTSGGGAGAAPLLGTADWRGRPLRLSVDAVDWPLATWTAWTPSAPEVGGTLNGQVELAGSVDAPRGRAELTAAPLTVAGIAVDRLAAVATVDGPRLEIESLRLEAPAGTVTAAGGWNRDSGALDGRLDAPGLALAQAPLADLVPGGLEGELGLSAEIGGTVEAPRVRLTTDARDLVLEGRPVTASAGSASAGSAPVGPQMAGAASAGAASARAASAGSSAAGTGGATAERTAHLVADWDGERLQADGSLLGLVDFHGGGALTRESADLSLALSVADVDRLLRVAAGGSLDGLGGSLGGELEVRGRFDDPRGAAVRLRLDRVDLSYQGRTAHNLEPVVVAYEPGSLVIDSFYLGEPAEQGAGELFVTGTIGLDGGGAGGSFPLDLRAQAELDAGWLELVLPDFQLGGRIQALTAIRGTVSEPRLNGQAEVRNGKVLVPDFPHAVEDLDAIALLYPDRVVLDSATAHLGGGQLKAAGQVGIGDLAAGNVTYRFQAQLDGATIRYPEGFVLRGDANLTLLSSPDGRLISGVVDLDRAFYLDDVPVGITQLLQNVFQPTRLEAGTADPELAATELNVSIQGKDALRVRNNVANLSGDVDLVVRGNLADPALFGQVELRQGGKIKYSDNDYEVQRGLITFANPYRIDPVIDFQATTEVRSYDITLNLNGTLDRLDASFSSDPPLANLEVVSLLTVGRPISEGALTPGDTTASGGGGKAAEQLLYGQATSLLAERVNTLFGFDRFRVSPATGAAGSSSLAVTVGQQISRDLYVTYSRDPSTPEVDILQVEWQVQDNVVVVLTSNGDSTYSLDVQIERRF